MESNYKKIYPLWERVFGTAWKTFGSSGLPLGAFMLDSENRIAVCSRTAAEFLGLTSVVNGDALSEVDFDILGGLLGRLSERKADNLPINFIFIPQTDKSITAGFVTLNSFATGQSQIALGLVTQSELFARLGECSEKVPLLLLKILGCDGSAAEQELCVFSAVSAIIDRLPEGALMSERCGDEFWVLLPDTADGCPDALEVAKDIRSAVENCTLIDKLGSLLSEKHCLTLMTGVCDNKMLPSYKMHAVTLALYQAMSNGKAGEQRFKMRSYVNHSDEYGNMVKFSKLLDLNLFTYHFQPIVSARTGEITAYEALMRTSDDIGFNPLQILELASRYGRLYDIELATLSNTFEILSRNQSYFEDRQLFINAIPSDMLTDEDFSALVSKYGELLEKIVIELTEQTELSEESADRLLSRIHNAKMQIAIDDYGTGYSNSSNLLRYKPRVVKIDRSLISDINASPEQQKLVSSIVDILHSMGMTALAEGVETFEEVKTVIGLNVDLLQGFYISRPKPVLLDSISDNIKNQIVTINLEVAGLVKKTYHAQNNEEIFMHELAIRKFTEIFVAGGSVTLHGDGEESFKIPVTVANSCEAQIFFDNILIESDDEPVLRIGELSEVQLSCKGRNAFYGTGISVPVNSRLLITGSGQLEMFPEMQHNYAIGNAPGTACGDITIDFNGFLNLVVTGDNSVAIGAEKTGKIDIRTGLIHIKCNSGSCTAIGSISGDTEVSVSNCELDIDMSSSAAVCIGSSSGKASVQIQNSNVHCRNAGGRLCGVGSLGGTADIVMRCMKFYSEMYGKDIHFIGTDGNTSDCEIKSAYVKLYGEGTKISGIGDMNGGGSVRLFESEIDMTFRSAAGHAVGSPNGTVECERVLKRIKINE